MTTLQEVARAVGSLPSSPFRQVLMDGPQTPARLRQCLQAGWPVWMPSSPLHGIAGLRMIPGTPSSAWPMAVGTSGGAAQTLGSALSTSAPLTYIGRVLPAFAHSGRIDTMLDEKWRGGDGRAVASLHAAMGGDAPIVDTMRDQLLLAERSELRSDTNGFILSCLDYIDPTDAQRAHLAVLHDLADATGDAERAQVLLGAPHAPLGVWLNHAAFATAQGLWTRRAKRHQTSTAWQLLHLPPQFDGGDQVRALGDPTGIMTGGTLRRAMVVVSKVEAPPDSWCLDPWSLIVLPAVTAAPDGAWHLSYMEAAAEYDARDEPEMAWNMLCAGAFWVSERGGPWRPFFDAARALAERRGWADCAWALNDMADRAELDRKPQTAVPGDGEDSP